ncbi:S8 family serine peptidase [Streptomyces sp. SCL15-4]|uniref:S8 family serine peptidase n=1 Tax=Streptomyces sp. SCL15-4 TaxID=2967221 RepID=UPI002967274A|nr:S8 family serine peptidase [Streptomyces sp. SCL15-4]
MTNGSFDRREGGEHFGLHDQSVLKRENAYTGKYLVLLDCQEEERGMEALRSQAGIAAAEQVRGAETENALRILEEPDVTALFPELGVAVVDVAPDQREALVTAAQEEPSIIAAEPERLVYISTITDRSREVKGYYPTYRSDEDVLERHTTAAMAVSLGPAWDETEHTWGLQAVRANHSHLTGQGVKVAVLDTGVDTEHPDLSPRIAGTASFVPGQSVQDGNGHGTHCIGTAAGPADPQQRPRYGVAPEAQILAGKVLSNQGSGSDGQILAGIAWALSQGAKVISMSLGAPVSPGQLFSPVFESLAKRVVTAGTLIVAAAGNDGGPVNHPANCPSILAVAAVGKALDVAPFSCRGQSLIGAEINIAAPGVEVRSAWPMPQFYNTISGTSMATPHVAGIVALLAQGAPDAMASELKKRLLSGAYRLAQLPANVGAGLGQTP